MSKNYLDINPQSLLDLANEYEEWQEKADVKGPAQRRDIASLKGDLIVCTAQICSRLDRIIQLLNDA